jgi:hypothetical protein
MFINFMCRKCKRIISAESSVKPRYATDLKPAYMSKARHKHCEYGNGLADGEYTIADMVSISDNPLEDAVDVYYKKSESSDAT